MRQVTKEITKVETVNIINAEDFKHWLKERGVFNKFAKNCFEQDTSFPDLYESRKLRPNELISSAFCWCSCQENEDFWEKVSEDWEQYCEDCKIMEIERF